MPNDPYQTLGLTKQATADDIKKAYRKMARTSHPDLNPDDPGSDERFKAISATYEILKDPETRACYDEGEIDGLGAEQPKRQYYRDFSDASDNVYQQRHGFGPDADPGDIFAEILRNRSRGSGGGDFSDHGFSASGSDLRYSLEVQFLDAVRGSETRITLPDGQSLVVKIPRGTEDGQTLRLRGKGAPGFGDGPAGDALITVFVGLHPLFNREGNDILLTLPITIDEAILGGKVKVPTIDGPVSLAILQGASSGKILRLRGRGIERAGQKNKGDQRVELKIMVPPDPDESLRDYLTEWRKTSAFNPRADMLKGMDT
jgi:DnaJ-class molecular chaperone